MFDRRPASMRREHPTQSIVQAGLFMGLATLAFVLCAPPEARAQALAEPWRELFYNRKPADGDFDLPMPCGGTMTFRPVVVDSADSLDDRKIVLGTNRDDVAYKEGKRSAYIAAHFTNPQVSSGRFFYIGKYEVTSDQYNAIMEDECGKASMRGALPAANLSWFDAIDFTRRYTEWLHANAKDRLPTEGQRAGYIRLPTEVEWEFAVRGGLKVDKDSFIADRFPLEGYELKEYVWYQGTQSATGKLQIPGLLRPNPLGLHDMLGNVAEIVLTPFHLNRQGRDHGMAGGMVTRGGDIDTPERDIRSSLRQETSYFEDRTGQAKTQRYWGMRIVIAAQALTSRQVLQDVRAAHAALSDSDSSSETDTVQREAFAALELASKEAENERIRTQLEDALSNFRSVSAARNEIRDRAVRALIQSGAILGEKVDTDARLVASIEGAVKITRASIDRLTKIIQETRDTGRQADTQRAIQVRDKAETELRRQTASLDDAQQRRQITTSAYTDLVFNVATDYSLEVVAPQLEALILELGERELNFLIRFAQLFVSHLEKYRQTGAIDAEQWTRELTKDQ